MIVDSALYRGGIRIPMICAKDDLSAVRASTEENDDFVWVGLHEPAEGELEIVAHTFDLHPLAVEGRPARAPTTEARAIRGRHLPGPQDALVRRRGGCRGDR